MAGPSWIGIGAQRSGTTWLTDLLLQHPEVRLGRSERKELHALYRTIRGQFDRAAYAEEFAVEGIAGEWTPFYLRGIWVPEVAKVVTEPDVPFFVVLRDPVERFESAMRHEARRKVIQPELPAMRLIGGDAVWAGMYATQLSVWARAVGRDRMVVLQYEVARQDPQSAMDALWRRLGLDPVPLTDIDQPSRTSTDGGWSLSSAFRSVLRDVYAPEVDTLTSWGIDPSLWSNFT